MMISFIIQPKNHLSTLNVVSLCVLLCLCATEGVSSFDPDEMAIKVGSVYV